MQVTTAAGRRSRAAWEASYLAELGPQLREAMLRESVVATVPAGAEIYRADAPPRLSLLHSGLARVRVRSPQGREATIRYAGAGQLVGLPAVAGDGSPVGAEAVLDCELTYLHVGVVRQLARTDARVSWLFARQLAQIVFEVTELLADDVFGSVLQRVSRHLLDLASNLPGGLVVQVDQPEIAAAIGSVREVVGRTLRTLREQGCIERVPEGIRLVDPNRLHELAAGAEPNGRPPH